MLSDHNVFHMNINIQAWSFGSSHIGLSSNFMCQLKTLGPSQIYLNSLRGFDSSICNKQVEEGTPKHSPTTCNEKHWQELICVQQLYPLLWQPFCILFFHLFISVNIS